MITHYPEIPQEQIDRQGAVYMCCDAEGCDAEVEVTGITMRTLESGRRTVTEEYAPIPDKWVSSDPDQNALAGAADFCPDHADLIPVIPQEEQLPPVVDES